MGVGVGLGVAVGDGVGVGVALGLATGVRRGQRGITALRPTQAFFLSHLRLVPLPESTTPLRGILMLPLRSATLMTLPPTTAASNPCRFVRVELPQARV